MADDSLDLSGAIDMLKNMLSDQEGQSQIQNIMNMFQGSTDTTRAPGEQTGGINPDDIDMFLKLQKAMTLMNESQNNSRAQFLMALKPFLKPSRRDKVDKAMQLMKFSGMIEIMRNVQGD